MIDREKQMSPFDWNKGQKEFEDFIASIDNKNKDKI